MPDRAMRAIFNDPIVFTASAAKEKLAEMKNSSPTTPMFPDCFYFTSRSKKDECYLHLLVTIFEQVRSKKAYIYLGGFTAVSGNVFGPVATFNGYKYDPTSL